MNPNFEHKVLSLNVRELQECLEQLELRKQGKKAELQQRLLQLSSEKMKGRHTMQDVYQVLDAVLSKRPERGRAMPAAIPHNHLPQGSSDSALRELIENVVGHPAVGGAGSGSSSHTAATAAATSNGLPALGRSNSAIRCFCGRNVELGKMVQCEDELCGYWQHCACIGISTREQEDRSHYCEMCRMKRADPFWELIEGSVLRPVQLVAANGGKLPVPGGGNSLLMAVERTFQVGVDLMRRSNSQQRLVLACLQLMDPNPFRVHWPTSVEVRVNQMTLKPYHRNSQNKLGANQRDEPLDLLPSVVPGMNKVRVQCMDSYHYIIMIHLVRKRTLNEVRALLKPPQSLPDALQRVAQTLKGGDAEDDDDCVVENTVLSLKCPLTGTRMTTPARFSDVDGVACFDLLPFLQMAERTRKWQCPHSMRNTSIQTLQVDSYVQRILDNLRDHADVTEVEVSPEGKWRPAGSQDKWYHIQEAFEPIAQFVKQEGGSRDSDDSEDDELEELRKTAQAFKNANKRQRQDTEIIDLLSDSDDDADSAPPAQRQRLANGTGPSLPSAATNHLRQASHNAAAPGPSSTAATTMAPPPPPPPAAAIANHVVPPRRTAPVPTQSVHNMLMSMGHPQHTAPPQVSRPFSTHPSQVLASARQQPTAMPPIPGITNLPAPPPAHPTSAPMYPSSMAASGVGSYMHANQRLPVSGHASQPTSLPPTLPPNYSTQQHPPTLRSFQRPADPPLQSHMHDYSASHGVSRPAGGIRLPPAAEFEVIELDDDSE